MSTRLFPPRPPIADSGAGVAALLILAGCLSLAPFPLLGPSIGWPGSLDDPAATQLTRIGQAPQAVAAGYGVYLLYSLLFLPALALAAHRLLHDFSRGLAAVLQWPRLGLRPALGVRLVTLAAVAWSSLAALAMGQAFRGQPFPAL